MYPKIDFFVGLVLVIGSAFLHTVADRLPDVARGIGAGDYPKVLLKVLIVLGLLLSAQSYYFYRKRLAESGVKKYEPKEIRQVVILTVTVAAYIRLVALFGFVVLTPFFMFALMLMFGMRKWVRMAFISIATTAIVYFLFNNVLLVLLPRFNLF